MARLFAVGDIHGCVDELTTLLDALELGSGDRVVFLGDYLDRGPDPRGVIDRLLDLPSRIAGLEAVFLKGNHEDMFLAYLGERGRYGEAFIMNGGRPTLTSYGLSPALSGHAARDRLPPEHLDFLRGLKLWEVVPPVLLVHAGVHPLLKLEVQSEEDLLWIREEFIRNRHVLGYTVIFGHTPHREVLWHLPYKIGLDTGCVYGNKLSALELTAGTLFEVARGSSRPTVRRDLPELRAIAERCRLAGRASRIEPGSGRD